MPGPKTKALLPKLSEDLSFPSLPKNPFPNKRIPEQIGQTRFSKRQKKHSRRFSDEVSISKTERVRSKELGLYASGKTRQWVYPEYDHDQVEMLVDLESYFARAIRAKLSLFIKEGFEFTGGNEELVYYIKGRVAEMEVATGTSFRSLLLRTGRDLFVHSNAYWVKVRRPSSSGGRVRVVDGKLVDPVVGYFPLPPETVSAKVDLHNRVYQYRQEVGENVKVFHAKDVVHFSINEKSGYPFGVPTIVPVVGDIRTLRSIEEDVDVLIHKFAAPLVLWKVGTPEQPAMVYPGGETEVDRVRSVVETMVMEGSIVVSERFSVTVVGAESHALRVAEYLQYFRERVLSGLDVSSVDVGIGNTATKSTAQTLSRNIIDTVKLYQIAIENRIFTDVITELLLERGFSPKEIADTQRRVYLRFHEIDKAAQVATANHYMDLFLKNGITHQELRKALGFEPLTEEGEEGLFWNKFGKEMALYKGSDFESTGDGGDGVAEKERPKNQHGVAQGPKLNKDKVIKDLERIFQRRWAYGWRPQTRSLEEVRIDVESLLPDRELFGRRADVIVESLMRVDDDLSPSIVLSPIKRKLSRS
jgi:hypothetical protein